MENRQRKIIEDILWMAIRYAHGRHTYAPSMVRDAVKEIKRIYPDFRLRKDVTIKPPEKNSLGGMMLKDDYLDDLFDDDLMDKNNQ